VRSQETKHKCLEPRLKLFAPHYDSFPFTRLNTAKHEHFLLHVPSRDQASLGDFQGHHGHDVEI